MPSLTTIIIVLLLALACLLAIKKIRHDGQQSGCSGCSGGCSCGGEMGLPTCSGCPVNQPPGDDPPQH